MAVTASFTAATGLLSVFGDNLDNTVTTSRDAAGKVLVNSGAVAIPGGTPTVANTSLIQMFGQGGNDNLTLNETNGALPRANLFGGTGNDNLTGGSATISSSARRAMTLYWARAASTSYSVEAKMIP